MILFLLFYLHTSLSAEVLHIEEKPAVQYEEEKKPIEEKETKVPESAKKKLRKGSILLRFAHQPAFPSAVYRSRGSFGVIYDPLAFAIGATYAIEENVLGGVELAQFGVLNSSPEVKAYSIMGILQYFPFKKGFFSSAFVDGAFGISYVMNRKEETDLRYWPFRARLGAGWRWDWGIVLGEISLSVQASYMSRVNNTDFGFFSVMPFGQVAISVPIKKK